MKAFLTFSHGDRPVGTLPLELFDKSVPKTVESFCSLIQTKYKGSIVHRLIPGFMLQAGDFEKSNGTGGYSPIFGKNFADENFVHGHDKAGTLSMANAGPNTNGSQFFVTFRPTPHLDGKHVVFGCVDLSQESARRTLEALEQIRTDRDDRPLGQLVISECGVLEHEDSTESRVQQSVDVEDQDEIDLEDGVDDEKPHENQEETHVQDEPPNEEDIDESSLSKSEALKLRLRRLKQKMNQARQLNKQAVKEEGERSTQEGAELEKRREYSARKKAQEASWAHQNAQALAIASEAGVDAKSLTQQAVESVAKAVAKAEKDELSRFSARDYHNPEGQFRNYDRNLKSLPKSVAHASSHMSSTEIFNPIEHTVDPEQERQGARRISQELYRRIEKQKKREMKRKEREEEGGDVSYINARNKEFNKKINRHYDKTTAEIRQNLERGTAL